MTSSMYQLDPKFYNEALLSFFVWSKITDWKVAHRYKKKIIIYIYI